MSLSTLKIFLNDPREDINWDAIWYMIGQINYGGRVTDDKDVRLITALLLSYLNEEVMTGKYSFSSSGVYHTPHQL